jgi:small subunit ribosomal protein S8e
MNKGRKITGGKYHASRKRKKREMPGQPRVTKLGKEKKKKMRTFGGNTKTVLLTTDIANVVDKKGKTKKAKIKNVLETPSNRFLARRNILTKGAVIETELGKAKITNKPSQEGNVQAVLVE